MKLCIPIVLVMCIYLSISDSADLDGKSLIIDRKTATTFVRLHAADFSSLTAFTVCLRAASEDKKSYSLLSYAIKGSFNELLLWQKTKSQFILYLSKQVAVFSLPEMNSLLRHICVTWESKEGEITVWVNGRRSARKVGGKGRVVRGSGQFILGQEQDSVGGRFDASQSFVGEITDVHLWDRVLQPNEIELISQGCYRDGGNIIDWGSTAFTTKGNVKIKDNNDCTL